MRRADNYSLLLLVGGKSSRMGTNKAELLYEGRSFVENLMKKAEQLGISEIYLSGYQKEREDVRVVWDIYPEIGPLGGLHAGLSQVKTTYCLVLPVDIPQIPQELLEGLLTFHEQNAKIAECEVKPLVVERDGFLEPLIGIYPISMKEFIEEKILEGRFSVFRTLKEWGCISYKTDIPEEQIANINTKEDYEKLLK